jgi:diaminopimelate epimerase
MNGTVFYKMTGSGNDFVMLDGRHLRSGAWRPEATARVCDRRTGVGADGVVILTPEALGRVRMEYWNSDGSPAAMCGNAALCSTRLAAFLEIAPAEGMTLVTQAGLVETRCVGEGPLAEIRLPAFELPRRLELKGRPGESVFFLGTVGVPHLVVFTEDVAQVDLPVRGRELRFDPALGPAGANVNFISPPAGRGGPWRIRTYERGVEGETLACGTGTVAAAFAVAAARKEPIPGDWQTFHGAWLGVSGALAGGVVTEGWLRGEGRLVFTGTLAD